MCRPVSLFFVTSGPPAYLPLTIFFFSVLTSVSYSSTHCILYNVYVSGTSKTKKDKKKIMIEKNILPLW